MKREILRLLNLRTEKDFVKQKDYYQQEVLGRVDRFNKLVKDLSEDGIDVNKYLYSFERIINVSDWDTSKVTDISELYSQTDETDQIVNR